MGYKRADSSFGIRNPGAGDLPGPVLNNAVQRISTACNVPPPLWTLPAAGSLTGLPGH